MSKWHKVFSSQQLYQAEMIKGVLEENNVPAVVVPLKNTSYMLGHYEVHVNEEYILKALKIIKHDISFE